MWMEVEDKSQMAYSEIVCKKIETKVEARVECLDHNIGET
jgi:hypothetical protein